VYPPCSHGFCLFNNAAIGAAYAMNVYRHAGIKRVAILDFDVHHGNGTGAPGGPLHCAAVERGAREGKAGQETQHALLRAFPA
jgi:hypothetical protein